MDLKVRGDGGESVGKPTPRLLTSRGETLKRQSASRVKATSATEIVGKEINNHFY